MKFAHATIMVKDLEESLKFYQEVVGLEIVRRFPSGPNSENVFLGEGETLIELIYDKENSDVNYSEDISLGFQVDSLDDMMKFVQDKQIPLHSGPFQPNPKTKFFYVLDPNGLKIQFIQQ